MRPIDFAATIRPSRRPGALWLALLVASAAVLAWGARVSWSAQQEIQRVRAEAVAAPAPRKEPQPAPRAAPTAAQAQAINAAIAQLNLPWRDLFDAVQHATPAGIALLSLEPDASRRWIRITGEARTLDDVAGYQRRLGQVALFKRAVLLRHERQEPAGVVRFAVEARWAADEMGAP
jgi:hypothetical protein